MTNYDITRDGKKYVKFGFWLVFTDGTGAPKSYAREPKLSAKERAMYLDVTLPKSLWQTPSLKATVMVADGGVTPIEINAEVAADAMKQAIGMDVEISIRPYEEKPE